MSCSRVGERHMHGANVEERADPALGPVHDLVGYDERAWFEVRPQRPHRARRQHLTYPTKRSAQRFAR